MSSIGSPSPRGGYGVVWTGTEMIVWGGRNGDLQPLKDGARYDPVTDSWRPLSTTDAPVARGGHAAVWTGSEMLVWGGSGDGWTDTGALYDPATGRWRGAATVGAPSVRSVPQAVWADGQMILWGGFSSTGHLQDTYTYGTGWFLYLQP